MVEMEERIARDVTAERVRRVAQGYTNAKGEAVAGLGGGFRYCQLGEHIFEADGSINPAISFAHLARHVYFTETGEPPPEKARFDTPLIGICRGVAVYLLFNGILGDKSVAGGNILTRQTLAALPPHPGPRVVYAYGCRLGEDRLRREQITFRQTPYEIKVQ
jgi:site-specific DNA-methyltransferase (adenine-specific)/adenine-specific DNA-methyltransferase